MRTYHVWLMKDHIAGFILGQQPSATAVLLCKLHRPVAQPARRHHVGVEGVEPLRVRHAALAGLLVEIVLNLLA